MDFVEGQNLRDFYKVRGKFEPLEATRIVADMMAGLNYAFQKGITHRDLKMSNVIVSSDGDAKLLDFGLAGIEEDADADDAEPAHDRLRRPRTGHQRPQGRHPQRHLLRRLHLLPD